MQLLGPVRRLRILSTLFPYLVSEDEQAMRNADVMLQSVPVKWYLRMKIQSHKDKNKKSGYLMDAVNDLNCTSFGGDEAVDKDRGGIPYDEKTLKSMVTSKTRKTMRTARITCPQTLFEESPNYSPYIAIDSTINVIDTKDGPSLEVVSNKYCFEDDDEEQYEESGFFSTSMTMRKIIPFKNMQVACAGDTFDWEALGLTPTKNSIMIFEKPKSELNTTVDSDETKGDDERGAVEVFESYSSSGEDDTSINNVYNYQCGDYDRPEYQKKLFVCQLILDSKLSLTRDEALRHLNTLIKWGDIVHQVDENKTETILNVIKKKDEYTLHPPSTIEVAHSPKRLEP